MDRDLESAKRLCGKEMMDGEPLFEYFTKQGDSHFGTAPTNCEEFNTNGYKVIPNICPIELIDTPLPKEKEGLLYYSTEFGIRYKHNPVEEQVRGALARYTHPFYKEAYTIIQKNIEETLNDPLFKTYYFDRFYYPGQFLRYHTDRPSCEISCTVHCSTNLKDRWPICIRRPDGTVGKVYLKPGDGMIYKGCERPHWRPKMPGVKRNKIRRLLGMDSLYYHQVFFHYVLANGSRQKYAGDNGAHNWETGKETPKVEIDG